MKLLEELSIKVNNLMKKIFLTAIFLFTLLLTPSTTFAQGMMGNWTSSPSSAISDDHTAREEAEGKEVWEKLQAKQLECKDLTNDNYAMLGEYFMGQSIGNTQRHALMNQMMTNMMGEEGEEQMHIAMGKRLSGCEPNTQVPSSGVGFMPMMWMMGGGGNPMMGTGWGNMMGGWNGFGVLGWIPMLLFWILLILGVVALVRYLGRSGQSQGDKTPLDILKERYARGEINKKEFEEKKRDLG
jgi:putative membrane protein